MILEIKVTPQSSKNEVLRWEENHLVVKIQGAPEKGKVNENLINFLAKILGIAKSRIEIISGKTSRFKKLNIQGMSLEDMKEILSKIVKRSC
ncbi:MAG: hypothetical protein RLZZ453_107 [Chlamydiota bacterium]|jgi:uncharacterized protein (TIGR00251 family)